MKVLSKKLGESKEALIKIGPGGSHEQRDIKKLEGTQLENGEY